MALSHNLITLSSSTATAAMSVGTQANGRPTWTMATVSIENVDGSANIYIGTSSVTTSSYGIKLIAGAAVTLDDLGVNDIPYIISDTNSSKAAVLLVTR